MLPLKYQIISTSARVQEGFLSLFCGYTLLFNKQELNFKNDDFHFKTLNLIQVGKGVRNESTYMMLVEGNLDSFLAYNVKIQIMNKENKTPYTLTIEFYPK